MQAETKKLIEKVRNSVIGEGHLIDTPFGTRPLIYADYTASGRSLTFVEDYITDVVLPFYANTHSEFSVTGRQSTVFREQSREMIRKSVNAGEDDAVIFCGSGATGAIDKMVAILNIRLPANLDDEYDFSSQIKNRPVVFVGPYEHHSNELSWRETIADVVPIPFDEQGQIDQNFLKQKLEKYADRKLKIGSFSASSNVTGLLSDVTGLSRVLHAHGALAFWDYAAAGPYVKIDMTGADVETGHDAIFLSPHKFVGGPGTSGVLVVKKKLLTNRVPAVPGGGTVSYVTPTTHTYLPAGEHREEGGTPAIVESIRTGLVFQLKDAVGAENIENLEEDMVRRALKRWSDHPDIEILGDIDAPRTSIISFQVMWKGRPLHFGVVVAMLNDLFGIQLRGGCSCAAPYGHVLLDLDMEYSRTIKGIVDEGHIIMKPGWVRLNFNYFIGEETFEYLLRAVELIAEHGWKLLGHYYYDTARNIWFYKDKPEFPCADLNLFANEQNGQAKGRGLFARLFGMTSGTRQNGQVRSFDDYLQEGEKILKNVKENKDICLPALPDHVEKMRWFCLPAD